LASLPLGHREILAPVVIRPWRVCPTLLAAVSLLAGALLACKNDEAATKACRTSGKASAQACRDCCKLQGAKGHKYVGGQCTCLGG
jgi:hypothetical protein